MQPSTYTPPAESAQRRQNSKLQPACPVCGGPINEHGRQFRCPRCAFVTCIGCEGRRGEALEDGD